jgi:SAM-dependent methyltransferase
MASPERPYREAARHYAARPPYSSALRSRLTALLGWDGAGRLLDVGCGPGIVALELAAAFVEVVGLDPEEEMLVEARRATPPRERSKVRWVRGRAEDLRALGLGRYDAVTFAQSFHRTDREAVADIVYDLLLPRGALLLIHHETAHGLEPTTPPPRVHPPHPPVPHPVIREVIARYLPRDEPTAGPNPERHEMLLARTRFGPPERLVLPGRADIVRTTDQVVDAYLGTAFAAPDRFGDRLRAFRTELADTLRRHTDTGAFWWWPGDTEVLVARRRA